MHEKPIDEQESLRIIHRMIETAKQQQKDNGIGWIIWGWLLFTGSILSFINQFTRWGSDFLFWNMAGAGCLLLLLAMWVQRLRGAKVEKVTTYTGVLFSRLNMGFFITLLIIILSMNMGVPPVKGFALLLGLYGFWILIYGAIMNFRPSFYGAYITWGFAVASLFVSDFKWTMLFHALAVLAGYIIPGYMANRAFKKSNA